MAGITGILDTSLQPCNETLRSRVRVMAEQSPNSCPRRTNSVTEETAGLALASVGAADSSNSAVLTSLLRSGNGRLVIAMTGGNGAFTAIRRALGRATSPETSETIVAQAIEQFGVGQTLALAEGPLAIAVWDQYDRTLTIGRDRYGQETLFAAWAGSSFIFGSHLFSIVVHPDFDRTIDRGAVAHYLRYAHLQAPNTIFTNAIRIDAGAMLTVHADQPREELRQQPVATLRCHAELGIAEPFAGSADAAGNALESALQTALREATSDPQTPMTLFFSGGLDSTLLASVATGMGERPIQTITTGFEEAGFDESNHAHAIANHLNLPNEVVPFTANNMRDLLPTISGIYQEPFGDLAALPAIHLAHSARDLGSLVVTGDGGDGLFHGDITDRFWNARKWLVGPARSLTGYALDIMGSGAERAHPLIDRHAPPKLARYLRPTRLHKAAAMFHAQTPEIAIGVTKSDTLKPEDFLLDPRPEPDGFYADPAQWLSSPNNAERWRFIRVRGFGMSREVLKHQRAITSAGLAYNGVMFHPAVAKLAWSLPVSMRDLNGQPRGLMRNVIERAVPRELMERKKAGFDVPFNIWLRGSLKDIGEDLLSEQRLRSGGIFAPERVRREWEQHLTGKYDRRYILFSLISFQLWVESMERLPVAP